MAELLFKFLSLIFGCESLHVSINLHFFSVTLSLPQQFCPRYTTVLQRTEEEGIGEDELDTLQLELENLLSNVSKRMRLLESK